MSRARVVDVHPTTHCAAAQAGTDCRLMRPRGLHMIERLASRHPIAFTQAATGDECSFGLAVEAGWMNGELPVRKRQVHSFSPDNPVTSPVVEYSIRYQM